MASRSQQPRRAQSKSELAHSTTYPHEKLLSSVAGGTVTALFMNPFDVVTRRMQAAKGADASAGPFSVTARVVRNEGALALWRGLPPTLALTVPATAFYFTTYSTLREALLREGGSVPEGAVPLVAGPVARAATVVLSSPLELARTNIMAYAKTPSFDDRFWLVLRGIVRTEGFSGLLSGLVPTLWRDVPFSAVYWFLLEQSSSRLRARHGPAFSDFAVDLASGCAAGAVAAVVTHPFDVAKTRRQMDIALRKQEGPQAAPARPGLVALLRSIVSERGVRGLYAGLVPRVAKIAPACAIMISFYNAGLGRLSDARIASEAPRDE